MKKKIIHLTPGRITLYDSAADQHFHGSLMINPAIKAGEIHEEADISAGEALLAEPVQMIDEIAEPVYREERGSSPLLQQYWNLIDFGLLFRFIALQLKVIWDSISRTAKSGVKSLTYKLKKVAEVLFYSEDKPVLKKREVVNKPQTGFWEIFKKVEIPKLKVPRVKIRIKLPRIPHFRITGRKISYPSKNVLKSLAIGCLIIAFASLGSLLLPILAAQIRPYIIVDTNTEDVQAKINNEYPVAQPDNLDPSSLITAGQEFRITIPKIDLISDISPYVDLSKELEYKSELLNTGVAHAKDSYLPGEGGPVFLFAHSTDSIFNIARFNAKFFYAKDLKEGDGIQIDFKGKKYNYLIDHSVIVSPEDVETVRQTPADLILMTCTPPGTDWQRLLIFAKQINTP